MGRLKHSYLYPINTMEKCRKDIVIVNNEIDIYNEYPIRENKRAVEAIAKMRDAYMELQLLKEFLCLSGKKETLDKFEKDYLPDIKFRVQYSECKNARQLRRK